MSWFGKKRQSVSALPEQEPAPFFTEINEVNSELYLISRGLVRWIVRGYLAENPFASMDAAYRDVSSACKRSGILLSRNDFNLAVRPLVSNDYDASEDDPTLDERAIGGYFG